jgi:Zn-dependent M28 family amino/carboxypeptidase
MKTFALIGVVLTVALVAAVAVVSDRSDESSAIDPMRLSEHIRVVSGDDFEGRAPASGAGEQKTIDYIVQQLTAVGVEPGGDRDAAGRRGWTQDVPLAQANISGPVTAAFRVGETTTPLQQGEQIAVRATHLPTQSVAVKDAPVVFLGYGVKAPERNWDDFKGVDVRGKVGIVLINDPDFEADLGGRFGGKAMTYYGRWTYKYEEAARQGMAGLLIVHEDAPASYGWATVRNSNAATMFDIVRENPAAAHPPVEGWIQRQTAIELFTNAGLDFEAEKKKAQSDEFRPVELRGGTFSIAYAVAQAQVISKNIVGLLPGRTRPDETVFYSAHWDHLGVGTPDANGDATYNGAQDNGTGIAALLDLARVFAAGQRPERSIVFLFVTAEEKGLLGSLYYGEHPLYPLARTVAVYNMDGLATAGPANDISVRGGGQVSLEDDVADAARAQGRRLSPDSRPEAGYFYRSDHFSFARVGVPAISIESGEDLVEGGTAAGRAADDEYTAKRYHQPDDEWTANMDLRGLAHDTELVYALGRDIANSTRWPEWKEGSEFKAVRDDTAGERR